MNKNETNRRFGAAFGPHIQYRWKLWKMKGNMKSFILQRNVVSMCCRINRYRRLLAATRDFFIIKRAGFAPRAPLGTASPLVLPYYGQKS